MASDSGTILLVEDDQNDVFFLKNAFQEAGIDNPVQVAGDGQQAIDYLCGVGAYSDRKRFPFPRLVLLDLKLPVKMGLDVLRWLQDQPQLQNLLVLVLTSSSNLRDVDEAYRLGVRAFLVKPVSTDERIKLARAIKQFWLELNESPSLGPSGPE